MGPDGSTRKREELLPALGQQIHQRVDDPGDRSVVGRVRDGGVERGVLGHASPAGGDLGPLLVEDRRHLRHLVRGGPARREARDGRLQEPACLVEIRDRPPLRQDHQRERLDQRLDGHLADEGALPRADPDEPATLERPHRLPDRRPADPEPLGQIPLRREPIPGLEPAIRDEGPDLPDDLLVDPGAPDGLQARPLGVGTTSPHGPPPGQWPDRALTATARRSCRRAQARPRTMTRMATAPWRARVTTVLGWSPSHSWTRRSPRIISTATQPRMAAPTSTIHQTRAMRRARSPLPQITS